MQNFSCNLTIDNLFYNRKAIGKNLLEIMKLKGHTKISFSKLTDISRQTLNNLFKGEINDKTIFKTCINKIIETENITLADIINYNENKEIQNINDYKFDPKDKEMLDILHCILHLYELYYCW